MSFTVRLREENFVREPLQNACSCAEFLNVCILVGRMGNLIRARAKDDHAAARLVDQMFGVAARQIADGLVRRLGVVHSQYWSHGEV